MSMAILTVLKIHIVQESAPFPIFHVEVNEHFIYWTQNAKLQKVFNTQFEAT